MLNNSQLVDCIETNGFYIQENLFSNDIIENLSQSFLTRDFKSAGIGSSQQVNSEIRGDSISWIEQNEQCTNVQQYISFIQSFKETLNKEFFLSLNDFEAHYAHYSNGGFYKKHLDNIQGKNSRIITFITYFNKNWNSTHGGELVIYNGQEKIIVPPKFNTFVCFLSDKIEHEVLPSTATRLSITGWLRNSKVI